MFRERFVVVESDCEVKHIQVQAPEAMTDRQLVRQTEREGERERGRLQVISQLAATRFFLEGSL